MFFADFNGVELFKHEKLPNKMKFDITLKQYELIYKIVASVGKELSHGAGKSCQFYNVNAAFILEKLFKVPARPIMGAAFVALTDQGDTLSFAGEEDGQFYSSPDTFHCWVETKNNILDFTSPEYTEALNQAGSSRKIERKMFQKEKAAMSASPYEMSNVGDFYFETNPELTHDLLTRMFESPATQDLAQICLEWCKKSKKKLKSLDIQDDLGEITSIIPVKNNITGVW